MIERIAGTLIEKSPSYLLVDYHGIGYKIGTPMSMFYNLPVIDEKVVLLTQQIMCEDAYLLYGLDTAAEREVFRQLTKISGTGARTTLTALSGMSVAELTQAVTLQRAGRLTRVLGIGKKTAEHLPLELKDKLSADLGTVPDGPAVLDDAVNVFSALLTLGYSDKKAALAIK